MSILNREKGKFLVKCAGVTVLAAAVNTVAWYIETHLTGNKVKEHVKSEVTTQSGTEIARFFTVTVVSNNQVLGRVRLKKGDTYADLIRICGLHGKFFVYRPLYRNEIKAIEIINLNEIGKFWTPKKREKE